MTKGKCAFWGDSENGEIREDLPKGTDKGKSALGWLDPLAQNVCGKWKGGGAPGQKP